MAPPAPDRPQPPLDAVSSPAPGAPSRPAMVGGLPGLSPRGSSPGPPRNPSTVAGSSPTSPAAVPLAAPACRPPERDGLDSPACDFRFERRAELLGRLLGRRDGALRRVRLAARAARRRRQRRRGELGELHLDGLALGLGRRDERRELVHGVGVRAARGVRRVALLVEAGLGPAEVWGCARRLAGVQDAGGARGRVAVRRLDLLDRGPPRTGAARLLKFFSAEPGPRARASRSRRRRRRGAARGAAARVADERRRGGTRAVLASPDVKPYCCVAASASATASS